MCNLRGKIEKDLVDLLFSVVVNQLNNLESELQSVDFMLYMCF